MRRSSNGWRRGCAKWREDTSLSTGRHTDDFSDDDAGEANLHGANRHGRPIRHVQHRHRWRVDVPLNNDLDASSRAGRRGYVNGNLFTDVGRRHRAWHHGDDQRHQRCAGHRNGWRRDAGRSDGRHQLGVTGAHWRSVMTMRAKRPSRRAKPTRQAHTARSTSAPMACGRTE